MKYSYIFLLLIVLLSSCTGSKKMYKQGQQLQEAGLIDQANEKFFQALDRNPNNIDAQIALKKSSEMHLSDLLSQFFIASSNNEHKKAVEVYQNTQKFVNRVNKYRINLSIPTHVNEAYKNHEDKYIAQLFEEAQDLLEVEKFEQAENVLKQITTLRSDLEDVQSMKSIAYVEPRYRKGLNAYDEKKYRVAYAYFDQVEQRMPNYKDARNLRRLSLEKGQFTIGVLKFENNSGFRGYEALISSQIISGLLKSNDPFLKVIDRTQTDLIIREQKLSLQGVISQRNTVLAGEMLGANALLSGRIINYKKEEGERKSTQMPGYLAKQIQVTDPTTKEVTTRTDYTKVRYQLLEQENRVSCQFQFQLINSETGEVLISETIQVNETDRVQYAFYNGDTRNLYTGHWTSQIRASAEDRVNNNRNAKRELNNLLAARQQVISIDELNLQLQKDISEKVIQKILQFNPEN